MSDTVTLSLSDVRLLLDALDPRITNNPDLDAAHARVSMAVGEAGLREKPTPNDGANNPSADAARRRLTNAIRAFTVETGDQPNGRAERAWLRLQQALRPRLFGTGIAEANAAAAELAEAMADDVKVLRLAAEGFFGGDFRKPVD